MRYLIALFLPPLAVLLCGKPVQAVLNCFRTLLFWLPGMIHALVVVADRRAEERMDRFIAKVWGPGEDRSWGGAMRQFTRWAVLVAIAIVCSIIVGVVITKRRSAADASRQHEPVATKQAPPEKSEPKPSSSPPAPAPPKTQVIGLLNLEALSAELEAKGFTRTSNPFQGSTLWTWVLDRNGKRYQCQALGEAPAKVTWASAQFKDGSKTVAEGDYSHFMLTFARLTLPSEQAFPEWVEKSLGSTAAKPVSGWNAQVLREEDGASLTILRP